MNAEENKKLILEYLDSFRTLPVTREMIDRYVSDRDEELKQHIEVFQAAAPGYVLEPHDVIAEGDKVVVRFTFFGRHMGEMFGYPPTGNELSFTGMIIYELEDRKIVNHWMEVDAPTLIQQISRVAVDQKETV